MNGNRTAPPLERFGKAFQTGFASGLPQILIEGCNRYHFSDSVVPFECGSQVHGIIAPEPISPRKVVGSRHQGFGDTYSYVALPLTNK